MGVVEWESGQLSALRSEPVTWSNNIRKLLALCNDLTPLSRHKVIGPEDEVKIFKKIEAAFVVQMLAQICLCHHAWCSTTTQHSDRCDVCNDPDICMHKSSLSAMQLVQ